VIAHLIEDGGELSYCLLVFIDGNNDFVNRDSVVSIVICLDESVLATAN
jgi:hypothetical protein